MTAERQMKSNLEIFQSMHEIFMSGEWEKACDTYFSDDLVLREPPGLPQQGVHRGRYAPIRVSNIYRAIWDMEIHKMELWEDGEVLVNRMETTWTNKATGKSLRQPVTETNRFRDGKIVEIEVFMFNPAGLMATLVPES